MDRGLLIKIAVCTCAFIVSVLVFSKLIVSLNSSISPGFTKFGQLFAKNPYCTFNPQCINVISNNTGPYILTMPDVVYSHGGNLSHSALSSENFAWPNYMFFMCLILTLIFLLSKVLGNRSYLWLGGVMLVCGFYVSEWSSWLRTAQMVGVPSSDISYLTLLFASMTLIGIAIFSSRKIVLRYQTLGKI